MPHINSNNLKKVLKKLPDKFTFQDARIVVSEVCFALRDEPVGKNTAAQYTSSMIKLKMITSNGGRGKKAVYEKTDLYKS